MAEPVLVLGANGYTGSAVTRELVKRSGRQCRDRILRSKVAGGVVRAQQ